jgi:GTPase
VRRGSEERAVIVGIDTGEGDVEAGARLDELAELVTQRRRHDRLPQPAAPRQADPRTLVGRGKLDELVSAAYHENADLLVFDRELTPAQTRELDKATSLKVLDRTQVILDIFAQNARGREAQVQVELAQLQYQLPRLSGRGKAMSRLGGGIGTRGPGETKLEVDRRRIRDPITTLEAEVDAIAKRRAETRKGRTQGPVPVVALVGYTNAGKSTLFNALAKSDVLVAQRAVRHPAPTTREGWLPGLGAWGGKVVFTDTVGFIRDLPSELVDAFRATLEELHDADLLLHVVDAAAARRARPGAAVDRILDDLKLERPRPRGAEQGRRRRRGRRSPTSSTRYDGARACRRATARLCRRCGGWPTGWTGVGRAAHLAHAPSGRRRASADGRTRRCAAAPPCRVHPRPPVP